VFNVIGFVECMGFLDFVTEASTVHDIFDHRIGVGGTDRIFALEHSLARVIGTVACMNRAVDGLDKDVSRSTVGFEIVDETLARVGVIAEFSSTCTVGALGFERVEELL
jgi:hypothetical protein